MKDIFMLLLNQECIDFLCKDAQDYKDASEGKHVHVHVEYYIFS